MDRWLVILLLGLLFAVSAICAVGCRHVKTMGRHDGSTEVVVTPDTVTVKRHNHSEGVQFLPRNASSSSPLNVGPIGVISDTSGTWQPEKINWIARHTWIFYAFSCVLWTAAAVLFYMKQRVFSLCVAASGVCVACIPYLIENLFWVLVAGAILFALCGSAYALAKYIEHRELRRRGLGAFAKLTKEENYQEAIAIARAIDPELDGSFNNVRR